MSLKVERKNLGSGYFTVRISGTALIYKMYKKNTDGTFLDIYGSTFEAKDAGIRVNIVDYDSLIVIYDKVDPSATVTIEDTTGDYSHFYTCSFVTKGLKNKEITVDPVIENPGNINISASVSVSINGITEVFEFPISGEYVASSSETIGIPVSNNSYTQSDVIENQNYSIYIPDSTKETDTVSFNRSTITNNTNFPMSVFLELKFFSISGKMTISPVVKKIRIIKHDNI